MPTLQIEHPITDFDTWKAAFERIAPIREESGVLRHRAQRPVGEPNFVVIDLDFDTASEAQLFLDFLQAQIWARKENSPALAGAPQPRVLVPGEGMSCPRQQRTTARQPTVSVLRT